MSKLKVFISNYPFARYDRSPLERLEKSGFDIFINPYERKMTPDETAKEAINCDIIIAGTENLTPLVEKSTTLKMISRIGIGLDSVPLQLCRQKNIAVAYTPDAVTQAVAELTIGMIINGLRKITLADKEVRDGKWVRHYGKSLSNCKIGIIGFGRAGYKVASFLLPYTPELLINDIADVSDKINSLRVNGANIREAQKHEIYAECDIITLHIPFTPVTKNLINMPTLKQMKKNAVLVNLSRGEIIHENDLYEALKNKVISQAALDVFCEEPYKGNLTGLENVILTQHMGACTYEGRTLMEIQAADSVVEYAEGKPLSRPASALEFELQESVDK